MKHILQIAFASFEKKSCTNKGVLQFELSVNHLIVNGAEHMFNPSFHAFYNHYKVAFQHMITCLRHMHKLYFKMNTFQSLYVLSR